MNDRLKVPTAAPWAASVGYSRAVRVGDTVYVSGTVAVDGDGRIAPPEDPYGQARRCLEIIADALAEAGASIADVVRTRMFVTDAEHWAEVEALKDELLDRNALSGNEACDVIRGVGRGP